MLKMHSIFSDNMILQRLKKVNVYGYTEPCADVVIEVPERGLMVETKASEEGYFLGVLPAQEEGNEVTLKVKSGGEQLVFYHVRYGEIWLAGGQSNMELELGNCMQAEEEFKWIKENTNIAKDICFYYTEKMTYESEEWLKKEAQAHWDNMLCEKAVHLSAIAYFAAKKLNSELKVPIGIINCSKGGTSIMAWLSKEQLMSFPEGQRYYNEYEDVVGDKTNETYLKEMEEYNKILEEYQIKVDKLKQDASSKGKILSREQINELRGPYPWPEPQGWLSPYRPGGMAEYMLKRVSPYTMRGVWYYQGEEDAAKAEYYETMLKKMITWWRQLWDEDLPFLLFQLAMYIEIGSEDDGSWGMIRQAQRNVAENMAMVSYVPLCDLGEFDNVHPTDKRTPGTRLGRAALVMCYDRQEEGTFMSYAGSFTEAGMLTLYFNHTYREIMLNTEPIGREPVLVSVKDAAKLGIYPEGFEIAGADGRFSPAVAAVEKDFIILSSPMVPNPIVARYAHHNFMRANVYNKKEMPLAAF